MRVHILFAILAVLCVYVGAWLLGLSDRDPTSDLSQFQWLAGIVVSFGGPPAALILGVLVERA